jgi:hypothetical protein
MPSIYKLALYSFFLGLVSGPKLKSYLNIVGVRGVRGESDMTASQDVEAAKEAVGNCGDSDEPQAGAYQPAELPDDTVELLAALAAKDYAEEQATNDADLQACDPDLEGYEVDVLAACEQVVAGMNYRLAFVATYPCKSANGAEDVRVNLVADGYMPLPNENAPPRITSVAPY